MYNKRYGCFFSDPDISMSTKNGTKQKWKPEEKAEKLRRFGKQKQKTLKISGRVTH